MNNKVNPSAALLTSCGGFYGVVGTASDHHFNDAVVQFLNHKDNHIDFYTLAIFSDEWEAVLQKYQLENTNKIMRIYFQFNDQKFLDNCKKVNKALGEGLHYQNLNKEISNTYREDFYTYYKLNGLATKGIEFIHDCKAKKWIPNWCCHSDNQASLHLANKLGFEQIVEHPMYWYNV